MGRLPFTPLFKSHRLSRTRHQQCAPTPASTQPRSSPLKLLRHLQPIYLAKEVFLDVLQWSGALPTWTALMLPALITVIVVGLSQPLSRLLAPLLIATTRRSRRATSVPSILPIPKVWLPHPPLLLQRQPQACPSLRFRPPPSPLSPPSLPPPPPRSSILQQQRPHAALPMATQRVTHRLLVLMLTLLSKVSRTFARRLMEHSLL